MSCPPAVSNGTSTTTSTISPYFPALHPLGPAVNPPHPAVILPGPAPGPGPAVILSGPAVSLDFTTVSTGSPTLSTGSASNDVHSFCTIPFTADSSTYHAYLSVTLPSAVCTVDEIRHQAVQGRTSQLT